MICQRAIEIIKYYEGLHDGDLTVIGLQPKRCPAGIWTIGYGHALRTADGSRFLNRSSDKAEAYRQAGTLTEEQAEKLLQEDLALFERVVDSVVLVPINENQRGALVSLTFNIGKTALKNSTLLQFLNNRRYIEASKQFLRWNKSKGKVLKGLINRRKAEYDLFNSAINT